MAHAIEEHGFVGNIWIRQNYLPRAGDAAGGHLHYHDHVSLLVKGSVEVQVGELPSKTFIAPTFIVIKKNHKHKITALEDSTVFYCLYAMRDIDGNVVDIYQESNLPYLPGPLPEYTGIAPDGYWGDETDATHHTEQ
jgi:hypothetical protein